MANHMKDKAISNLFLIINLLEKFHEIGQVPRCRVDLQVRHRASRTRMASKSTQNSNRLIFRKVQSLTLLSIKWETDKMSWLLHSL